MRPFFLLSLLCLAVVGVEAQSSQSVTERVAAVAIASGQEQPLAIALDEENVYWTSDERGTIKKANKAGGTPIALVTGQQLIHQLIVDEENIYFDVIGEIRRLSKNGGTPITLATAPLIAYGNTPLAADKTNIYFLTEVGKRFKVIKVSKGGGGPVTLATFSVSAHLPVGLASDGAYVYWGDYAIDTIKKVSINGGPPVAVGHCRIPIDVAVDTNRVYCDRMYGGITRIRKTGGTFISPLSVDPGHHRFTHDEMNLYLLREYDGKYGIYRIRKSGGRPVLTVPLRRFERYSFAVDSSGIYWTDAGTGAVMRLSK
jgi:hypothetical protein